MVADFFAPTGLLSSSTAHWSTSATASATSSCEWGQSAFSDFSVVPPNTGIVHQVNLGAARQGGVHPHGDRTGSRQAYPDTLVGTDSHTTMINGLGVLGWGVGGIEAEAAMLGQPVSMLIPKVVGFKLVGELPAGRHRHRPRADRHRAAAHGMASSASSWSSTAPV